MTDRSFELLEAQELIETWVAAFQELANDHTSREALAVVETLGDEFRARGLSPPTDRVVSEMAGIATQMRAAEAQRAPPIIDTVQRALEDDLMSFVAERNADPKSLPKK